MAWQKRDKNNGGVKYQIGISVKWRQHRTYLA
jgi:hypothetical protein